MKWKILVNIDDVGNHYKFWAYAINLDGYPTGEVRYGRIGSIGVKTEYKFPYEVSGKISEKLNKGYWEADEEEMKLFPQKMLVLWEV